MKFGNNWLKNEYLPRNLLYIYIVKKKGIAGKFSTLHFTAAVQLQLLDSSSTVTVQLQLLDSSSRVAV